MSEFENSFDNEQVPSEDASDNKDFDEVSSDSQQVADDSLDINLDNSSDEFDDGVKAQRILIPEETKPSVSLPNKGLRVFCCLLAVVIILSGCMLGGYFLGKNDSLIDTDGDKGAEITLQDRPSDTSSMTAAKVYSEVADSIVGILVYNDDGDMGEASGVIFSDNGYIITNDHIYSEIPSAKFKVFLSDGNEYNAYYVAGDTRSDLAVLKLSDNVKLSVPEFGDSTKVVSGEEVCAIGCPNGYSSRSTITTGIISVPKVRKSITTSYTSNFIQTDTAINPGNSGGALVNMYGQVIGITSSKIANTAYEGVGYAIPTKTVKKIAESLIEHGNVKNRAKLGITYYFYNKALAEIADMDSCGLLVEEVSQDSSLYGQLSKGDLIVRVNDKLIYDDAIILDTLEECNSGDTILLTVIKSTGETVNLNAELLNDEGSSSYVNSVGNENKNEQNGGSFDWPEGY